MKIPLHNLIENILGLERCTSPEQIRTVLNDKKKMKEVADRINALHNANISRKSKK